jgi:hypothetical protein
MIHQNNQTKIKDIFNKVNKVWGCRGGLMATKVEDRAVRFIYIGEVILVYRLYGGKNKVRRLHGRQNTSRVDGNKKNIILCFSTFRLSFHQ